MSTRRTYCNSAPPRQWRRGWAWPPTNVLPPGWPLVQETEPYTLDAAWLGGELCVHVLDSYAEDTDDLVGDVLEVRATDDGFPIRLRPPGDKAWYESALVAIGPIGEMYGCQQALEFDDRNGATGKVLVRVTLYGRTNGPEVAIVVNGNSVLR